MKIAVIGAGAMGSLLAGLLQLAGQDDVWLVGSSSSQAHLAATGREGLGLEISTPVAQDWPGMAAFAPGPHPVQRIRGLRLAADPAEVAGPVDLAVVLVKSYRTLPAAQQARSLLADDGVVVTLQNGLGNYEQLARVVGASRAAQGVTALGSTWLEPGLVRWAGLGSTALGLNSILSGRGAKLLETLTTRLQALSLPVTLAGDVTGLVWGKLIINCAINPLTAILNCSNGGLLDQPASVALLEEAATEAARVAVAHQIALPYPASEAATQARRVAAATAPNISSMLVDLRRGSQTEIEAINGAVVRAGQAVGSPAPLNRTLYLLVKARQERAGISSPAPPLA